MGERFKMASTIRDHVLYVNQPASAGRAAAGPTPLEYLLLLLGGCIATIGRIVARQQRIAIRGMDVRVEGDLDVGVLLGKGPENRVGFTGSRVTLRIDADLSQEQKEPFLNEVDRRHPVSEHLRTSPPCRSG